MNTSTPERVATQPPNLKAKNRIAQVIGIVLLVSFSLFGAFSLYLGLQTFAWQTYVAAGVGLAAVIASVVVVWLSLQNSNEWAGWLIILSLSAVAIVGAVFYVGVGLPFGVVVLVLILVVAMLLLPVRKAAWAMLAGVGVSISCGLIDLLSPAVQVNISSLGNLLVSIGAAAALVLSVALLLQYRSMALANKILVAFLFVTLLAAGIVAFVSANSSTRALTASVGMLQHRLAEAQSKTIGDLLERQVDILETLALDDDLQQKVRDANTFYSGDVASDQAKLVRFDEQWKMAYATKDLTGALVQSRLGNLGSTSLRNFNQDFKDHVELFFTDRMGGLVSATNMTSDYNQADEEWWQQAWNGGKGGVYFGAPEYDDSAGVISINIAIPITDEETQEVIGILRTTYLLDALHDFIVSIRNQDTGQTDLLFQGEPALLLRDEGEITQADAKFVADLVSGSFDYTTMMYEGDKVLLSQAVVKSSTANPVIESLGWRIIVRQDLNEALAPVAAQTRLTLMATLLVVGLVVGAAILSAQVLARPIGHLTSVAVRIREGDLQTQAQVETQDEFGVLAETINSMTSELRKTLEGLETRVADRTRELALAGEVSNILSQELDLDQLLNNAVELVKERFKLYYTQIYLYNPSQQSLVLRAGSGSAGAELRRRGHRLPVSSASINGKAALDKQPVVVEDVTRSPNFRPNLLLPETRSEAAIPMLIGERLVGVLDLQSNHPDAFDMHSLPAFKALAGQLAVAVENAATFLEIQEAKREIERRVQAQTRQGWLDFLDGIQRSESIGYQYQDGEISALDADLALSEQPGHMRVPILISGESVGVLAFDARPGEPWSPEQVELVEGVVAQAATQMENLRLLAQTERYRLEAEETARRLTRRGWDEYYKDLQTQLGYVYDQAHVQHETNGFPAPAENVVQQPLLVRDTPIGALVLEGSEPPNDEDMILIQTVAESLSAHIDSLRLNAQTQVALSNMETLNEVTRAATQVLELDLVLDEILDRILAVSGFGAGLISIEELETNQLRMLVHRNLPDAMVEKLTTFGLTGTPCDVVYRSGDTVHLSDLERLPEDLKATNLEDGFVRQAMQRPLAMGFHSYFGLPLVSKGRVKGTICLFDQGNLTVNAAKISLLDAIGKQVGILVDNAQLFQSTQKALSQTESLYEAIAEMNLARSYDDVLVALAKHTVLGRADQILMMAVLDRPIGAGQEPEWIYPVAWSSQNPVQVARRYPAAFMGSGMVGNFNGNEIAAIGGLEAGSPMMQALLELFAFDLPAASVLAMPLTLGGQVIGFVLGLFSQKVEVNEDELSQMKAVAGQAAIAVESRLLLEQAQTKARQEQRLREVSANVFAASNVDAILRRAVEQVGRTLGAPAYIYLGDVDKLKDGPAGNGSHTGEETLFGSDLLQY